MVFSVGSINADLVIEIDGPPTGTLIAEDVRLRPGGARARHAILQGRSFGGCGESECGSKGSTLACRAGTA